MAIMTSPRSSLNIERLDLFLLALLLHDTGKARRNGDHCAASVESAESLVARLDFDPEERETVRALIRNHLNMSVIMRRDIFDPENIRSFAESVGSQANLKMLCLLTYADVKALPIPTLSLLGRPIPSGNSISQLRTFSTAASTRTPVSRRLRYRPDESHPALVPDRKDELRRFSRGPAARYLQSRLPEQIRNHFRMALTCRPTPCSWASA